MQKSLATSLRYLKGIGPKRAKVFSKVGINTIEDLFYYFPRRYEDRTHFCSISELEEGEPATIQAEVLLKNARSSFKRRQFSILEVVVKDATGKIFCVWFNQPYLKEYFKVGSRVVLYGKVERYGKRLQMNSPEFEVLPSPCVQGLSKSLDIGRIIPIYSLPQGFTQRSLRTLIYNTLEEYLASLSDFLPYDIRSRHNFPNLAKSLRQIHFPENFDAQKEALRRLSFEEFFLFQLPLALRKLRKKEKLGIAHQVEGALADNFIKNLPFRLTKAQERVVAEIKSDMAKPQAMQRLLQGDVGSGKTVVATIASLIAIQGGYQVAFMVPTEILAKQHYEKIRSQSHSSTSLASAPSVQTAVASARGGAGNVALLRQGFAGLSTSPDKAVRIEVLTGSAKSKEKDDLYRRINEGKVDLLIGTHALLEEDVKFKNLGLVVIDEQHKFGVGQRALLPKKGINPDVLIMTATPIPRTLAITLYADLDISIINELPPGRQPVKTLRFSEPEKSKAYEIAKEHLKKGNQAYIVYPVIEESYALDIAGAKKMYEELRRSAFKGFNLGLIHGRLKQKEQDEIMLKFKNKQIDLLVSTTVLEVGIDIPAATCMLVEYAERFGLAQLHQLRGRIGRGALESVCILVSEAKTQEANSRLKAMVTYSDGFRIAEEDLRIRGPGEFFGSRQHGLSELKIANPLTQMQLLKLAREEALRLLNLDPCFKERSNLLLKEKLLQRFPEYEKLVVVG